MITSSCTVFKTINVDATVRGIKSAPNRTVVTIHEKIKEKEFVLERFVFENDSIMGIVVAPPDGKRHSYDKETFKASAVMAYDPLSTMHIFTMLDQISPGPFRMSIDSVKSIEIHEKDKVMSNGQNTALVVGGSFVLIVVVSVTIIAVAFSY